MKGTIIVRHKTVKPYKPILVAGLPGIGYVGRLVALHLIKEYKAEKFATLYSDSFPYEVIMTKKGTVRIANNRFYLIKRKKPERDIVILTGDVQAITSEGQYEVNTKIIDLLQSLGGTFVYTIGGYNSGVQVQTPRVYGSATSTRVIETLKDSGVIFGQSRGSIIGSAGLLVAFAKAEKLDGVCLMGESSMLNVDAAAAKAVIKTLSKILNLKVDTTHLDKLIDRTAKAMKAFEEKMKGSGFEGQVSGSPSYIR